MSAIAAVLGRWLEALNARGDLAATRRALDEDVHIERCGFHGTRDQVVQVLQGVQAANDWLALTRDVVQFRLDGEPRCGADGGVAARYAVVTADFRGGGEWRMRLAADGRIAWLRHQPDDLDGSAGASDAGHGHDPGQAHDHG